MLEHLWLLSKVLSAPNKFRAGRSDLVGLQLGQEVAPVHHNMDNRSKRFGSVAFCTAALNIEAAFARGTESGLSLLSAILIRAH